MTRRSCFVILMRIIVPAILGVVTGGPALGQESWDAHYVGGSKIGYTHTFVERVKDKGNGKEYLRVRLDIALKFKRDKDVSVMKMQYGTIETLSGEVLRLDTRTLVGEDNDLRAHGDVIRGEMVLKFEGNGERQSLKIPWGPDIRGPYAAEQSMARTPMKEHEVRHLKMFIPDLNRVAEITLTSKAVETVIMGDGSKRPLLRIEQTTQLDGKLRPEFNNIMWADTGGQVLKAEQEALGKFITYRTTKEAALAPSGPVQFDLITGTVIKTARPIPNAEQTRQVKYRLTFDGGDIAQAIPTDPRQTVQIENNPHSAILTIKSLSPIDGQAGPAEVDAQYLKSNVLITSDDSRVRTPRATGHARSGRSVDQSPAHESMGFQKHHRPEFPGRFRGSQRGRAQSERRLLRTLRASGRHVPGIRYPGPRRGRACLRRPVPGLRFPHVERSLH